MSERVDLEIDTLTIRIPMRLQRRGGRKLIMTPEGVTAPARKPSRDQTLIKALVRAHRWRRRIESRSGEVDHRPCGARGRHGRLRLPAPAAHLPGARRCGSDPKWTAAQGAQARRVVGERAACIGGAAAPLADLMVEIRQVSEPCAMRRPAPSKILPSEAGDPTARVQQHPFTAQSARGLADRPDEGRLHFDRREGLPRLEGRMHSATHGGVEEKREPAAMDQPHGIVEAGRGRRLECHAADLD